MDLKAISSLSQDSQNMLEALYREKADLTGTRDEVVDRIETLEVMIEAEEGKAQLLSRHLPDRASENKMMQSPPLGATPSMIPG